MRIESLLRVNTDSVVFVTVLWSFWKNERWRETWVFRLFWRVWVLGFRPTFWKNVAFPFSGRLNYV